MRVALRPARLTDAAALLDIKDRIRLRLETATSRQLGGFLLGTSLAEYRQFIQHDVVLVAESDCPRQVVGFAIVMQHDTLMQSELLKRAEQVQWEAAFRQRFDARRLAFFEQLGMLPDAAFRVYAKYLAFAVTWQILQTHEALFTTVLQYPFVNTAALSFIKVVGFQHVGVVDEVYADYGRIKSDVYHLERRTFERTIDQPRFKIFLERARQAGYWPQEPA